MLANLQGKTQTELQSLRSQIVYDYFADSTTETMRDEMDITLKVIDKCLPHSFVLADLFDVESMTLDIPLEVYEADPAIGFITCPDCEGEGWIEVEGSAWYNRAWALHTFTSMKPCTTCHCEGVVFTALEPLETEPETYSTPWLLAA